MKKTIILIEDDKFIAEIYYTILKKDNEFDVLLFNSGEEVLSWDKNKKVSLIFLDLILPDITGLDLLRKMRKDDFYKDVPVFVVTNYTSKELEKMASDLNVEKYINKANLVSGELLRLAKEKLK